MNKTDSDGHFPKLSEIFTGIAIVAFIVAAGILIAGTGGLGGGALALAGGGMLGSRAAAATNAAMVGVGATCAASAASMMESSGSAGFNKDSQHGNKNSKKQNNAQQLKKIKSNSRANEISQEFGFENAEEFKESIVGKGSVEKFNMKYNPDTNEIILEAIKGGLQVPTGYYIP